MKVNLADNFTSLTFGIISKNQSKVKPIAM